jgi:hypothetical protein
MTDAATSTPILRAKIRSTWMAYTTTASYDLTRAALDFIPQGLLTPIANFAETQSSNDAKLLNKFKTALKTATDFTLPKISALTHLLSLVPGILVGQTIGRLIGQFARTQKEMPYTLDSQKKGPINRAVTNFSIANTKYLLLGSLAAASINGLSLTGLFIGAGIAVAGNQIVLRVINFIASKLAAKTPPVSPTTPANESPSAAPTPVATPEAPEPDAAKPDTEASAEIKMVTPAKLPSLEEEEAAASEEQVATSEHQLPALELIDELQLVDDLELDAPAPSFTPGFTAAALSTQDAPIPTPDWKEVSEEASSELPKDDVKVPSRAERSEHEMSGSESDSTSRRRQPDRAARGRTLGARRPIVFKQ